MLDNVAHLINFFMCSLLRVARSWREPEICLSSVWMDVQQSLPRVSHTVIEINYLQSMNLNRYIIYSLSAGGLVDV